MKRNQILGMVMILSTILISCENELDEGNRTMSSKFNDKESHNAGQNCMGCHKSGGKGESIFTVAGTIYNSGKTSIYPNATVKLYSGANGSGTLVETLEVDGKGNFYTTEDIVFGDGLYTTVTGTSGSISTMVSSISNGQCNSCHNSTSARISVN